MKIIFCEHFISIASGIVADESINCRNAYEIGVYCLSKTAGNNFAVVTFKRKNRVMPIHGFTSNVKVHDELIPVNPDTIFRRIFLLKNLMQSYFEFELPPFPLSLFDEGGLRKTRKSVFYDLFSTETDVHFTFNVINGGFLLHRVLWQAKE
ncbi:hypothetical protein AVEN_152897-1 [Araneus ventricosus]|uniref:Uncharacterized protein n=1 Tax=Araneus ventricosus TaxID=182803 RepID=A0A4Y2ADA6_ARAVE|nr:hypothetical protein AVEN_152897-1 [Araneus ventricosus]